MALFKGDAQLLWNQFSELREPQVKSFYLFSNPFPAFFTLSLVFRVLLPFHFYMSLFSLSLALFYYLLLFLFSFSPFSIYLSFVNRCFLPQDTRLEICSSQTIFPISCMITKVEAHIIETPLSQNLTKNSQR